MKYLLLRALLIIVAAGLCWFLWRYVSVIRSKRILAETWRGYKQAFILPDGRVQRRKEQDTVSEGQAYAMLRAAWMGDKETFDRCFRWSEENLVRRGREDSLLAWHWKDGAVTDWMPASDADLDYAVSLVFAQSLWPQGPPPGLPPYGERARQLSADILRTLTFSTPSGRLYLSPWILSGALPRFPQNPSYYSPGHFRILHQLTGDRRWLKLADTTYFLLDRLRTGFAGEGAGFIPDWCDVDDQDRPHPRPGKNASFGWDAVRGPIRIGWDYFWFASPQAKEFLSAGMTDLISKEWSRNGTVAAEHNLDGGSRTPYENPAFYAAYYHLLSAAGSPLAPAFLNKTRAVLTRGEQGWFYGKPDYYTNSLAWLAEGLKAGVVRNLAAPPS